MLGEAQEVLVTSFYFLLFGIAIGVVIGFAHALDRDIERHQPIDLARAWQHRRIVRNELARTESNRRLS